MVRVRKEDKSECRNETLFNTLFGSFVFLYEVMGMLAYTLTRAIVIIAAFLTILVDDETS